MKRCFITSGPGGIKKPVVGSKVIKPMFMLNLNEPKIYSAHQFN